MTFPGCTFRIDGTAIECAVCGLVLGDSGPRDCPRASGNAVRAPAPSVVRSTGASGVAVRHRLEERAA